MSEVEKINMIKIVDCASGEEIEREMTGQEIAQREKDLIEIAKEKKVFSDSILQTETDKAALLAKLGITADEAKLLLS
jgi:hypothetical protein